MAATRTFSSSADNEADVLAWTKVGPVFDNDASALPSIYWPWVLDTADLPVTFPDRYAMYYSTDHASAAGVVGLATAPTPGGPWTDLGQVFKDPGPGVETETPAVWWDPDAGLLRMLYQQAGAVPGPQQSTLQATSTDGRVWTKLPTSAGIVVRPGEWPGNGHTGYAIVLDGAGPKEKVAYHLLGGGDRPHFGLSHSADHGATWRTDPRPLLYGYDQVAAVQPGYRIEWNSGHLYRFHGRTWWVGLLSSFGSGPGAVARSVAQAPLGPDGRHLLGAPRPLFPADPLANYRAVFVLHDRDRDVLCLYYQIDQVLYLAEATNAAA